MPTLMNLDNKINIIETVLDVNDITVGVFKKDAITQTFNKSKISFLPRVSLFNYLNYFNIVCEYALLHMDRHFFIATARDVEPFTLPLNVTISRIYNADKKISQLTHHVDYFIFENLSVASLDTYGCLTYLVSAETTRFDDSKILLLGN